MTFNEFWTAVSTVNLRTINVMNLVNELVKHVRLMLFDGDSISHKNIVVSLTQYFIDNSVVKDDVDSLIKALNDSVDPNEKKRMEAARDIAERTTTALFQAAGDMDEVMTY